MLCSSFFASSNKPGEIQFGGLLLKLITDPSSSPLKTTVVAITGVGLSPGTGSPRTTYLGRRLQLILPATRHRKQRRDITESKARSKEEEGGKFPRPRDRRRKMKTASSPSCLFLRVQ